MLFAMRPWIGQVLLEVQWVDLDIPLNSADAEVREANFSGNSWKSASLQSCRQVPTIGPMMFVGLRDEMQPELTREFPESVYVGRAEAGPDCSWHTDVPLVSARPLIFCREAVQEILGKKLEEGVFTAVVHVAALEQGSELDVLESALLLAKAQSSLCFLWSVSIRQSDMSRYSTLPFKSCESY